MMLWKGRERGLNDKGRGPTRGRRTLEYYRGRVRSGLIWEHMSLLTLGFSQEWWCPYLSSQEILEVLTDLDHLVRSCVAAQWDVLGLENAKDSCLDLWSLLTRLRYDLTGGWCPECRHSYGLEHCARRLHSIEWGRFFFERPTLHRHCNLFQIHEHTAQTCTPLPGSRFFHKTRARRNSKRQL